MDPPSGIKCFKWGLGLFITAVLLGMLGIIIPSTAMHIVLPAFAFILIIAACIMT